MTEEKARLRKLGRVRRARAFEEYGSEARRLLARHDGALMSSAKSGSAMKVAGYYPIKDEIDCIGLLNALRARSAEIALPRMRGKDEALDFHKWDNSTELQEGEFGVMEPLESDERVVPDLVILPLIAFDLRGGRLGYGGGYYDRTLSVLRNKGDVIAVGAGFDEQEIEEVPRGDHDQHLDVVLTPTRFIKI